MWSLRRRNPGPEATEIAVGTLCPHLAHEAGCKAGAVDAVELLDADPGLVALQELRALRGQSGKRLGPDHAMRTELDQVLLQSVMGQVGPRRKASQAGAALLTCD